MEIAGMSVASIATVTGALVVLGGLGSVLTDTGPWYKSLRKPWFQPPDFLFGPAWTLIFIGLGSSAVLAWNSPIATSRQKSFVVAAFAVNFVLNSLWSFLFFTKRRPDFALVEVALFWISIVVLIAVVKPLSSLAATLLAPYLAWVSFATVLNQRIVALNAPFSRS